MILSILFNLFGYNLSDLLNSLLEFVFNQFGWQYSRLLESNCRWDWAC